MQIALKQTICATLVVVTTLLLPVTGQAATYYVATNGSNGNPGTSTKPWQTIAHAVKQMTAGDTTYVRKGTYKEKLIQFGRSGTSSAPIKLLSAPGEFPIIDFTDKASSKMILFQNFSGTRYPMGWITIEGFEIKNGYNGIKMHNGQDLTIRRNWIHDSRNSGILGNGVRVLIDRNRINHNAYGTGSNPGGHGIYANGTAFTITNNLIYDNWTYGIQQNGSTSSLYRSTYHPSPEFAVSANWIVANNTIAYNKNSAGMVVWGSTCNRARIENNVFYENAVNGLSTSSQGINFISTTCTGITIRNNLAYASGSGGVKFLGTAAREGTHYTQSGNIVNTINPRFVNAPATLPSSPNFSLASGSPAIDRGLPLALAPTKISYPGTTRPKGSTHDVGAYEYSSNATQSFLTAPTSAQSN
ncbi:right-handed parallel beta-helix repeat-containing protein [Candidatus Nitrospira nitrificans]|uniref:Uncharacterized protein n=1 Tax=Candidatus Nitrospira nitrificans TaxID=1742973 RepID=A0A0S4L900_9BACT|nr:right-handed parallel beta-helix repeat-containing protein [Candidatus Nitrospira nitrificans]CUS34177.1 exported hypothetical protein [Candidatus Nitrospira nitrificans]